MPRKSRTVGATYGQNSVLSDASAIIEDAAVSSGGPGPAAGSGGAPVPVRQPPGVNPELLARAAAGPSPAQGGLLRPSEAPREPLTAGIDMGPGPGSRFSSPRPNQLATTYESLAAATGDPFYARLAAKARR